MKKMREWISSCLILGCFATLHCFAMQDPTRPPNFGVATPAILAQSGAPVLSVIYIYPNDRFAIINDQIMQVGDNFGSNHITNITENTVTYTDTNNESQVLTLIPNIKRDR